MDPTKKELYTAKRSSGVNVNYDPKVQEAIQQLTQNTSINWFLVKVVNSSDLALHHMGSEGINELLSSITNDDIYYGFFKCIHRDTSQVRYFSLYFMGENVNGMKKGKSSLYKTGILNLLDTNGEIPFNNLSITDFNVEYILNEVSKLSKLPRESLIV